MVNIAIEKYTVHYNYTLPFLIGLIMGMEDRQQV